MAKFTGTGTWVGSQKIQKPNEYFIQSEQRQNELRDKNWVESKFVQEGRLIECFGEAISLDDAMKIVFGFDKNRTRNNEQQTYYQEKENSCLTVDAGYSNLVYQI